MARPSPACPPLQTEICEAVYADGRKARTLNWTKPQPYLVRAGTQYAKKKEKKRRGKRKKIWITSRRSCRGAYEWMTVRESGGGGERINSPVKERISRWGWKLRARLPSFDFFLHDRHHRNSRIESAITRSTNCEKLVDSRNRLKTMSQFSGFTIVLELCWPLMLDFCERETRERSFETFKSYTD